MAPLPPALLLLIPAAVLPGLALLAGVTARRLLGRLSRGARVPRPWCEVGVCLTWSAVGTAAVAGVLPLGWVPALLGVGWLAVAAGAVDVLHRRLPDALTLPALPAVLVLLTPVGADAVLRGLAGAAVAFGVHAAVHLAVPAALGAGDVKLAAPLGAVLAAASWEALAVGGLLAAVLTAGVAAVLLVRRRGTGLGAAVPHGPSMLAAAWLVAVVAAVGRDP